MRSHSPDSCSSASSSPEPRSRRRSKAPTEASGCSAHRARTRSSAVRATTARRAAGTDLLSGGPGRDVDQRRSRERSNRRPVRRESGPSRVRQRSRRRQRRSTRHASPPIASSSGDVSLAIRTRTRRVSTRPRSSPTASPSAGRRSRRFRSAADSTEARRTSASPFRTTTAGRGERAAARAHACKPAPRAERARERPRRRLRRVERGLADRDARARRAGDAPHCEQVERRLLVGQPGDRDRGHIRARSQLRQELDRV